MSNAATLPVTQIGHKQPTVVTFKFSARGQATACYDSDKLSGKLLIDEDANVTNN